MKPLFVNHMDAWSRINRGKVRLNLPKNDTGLGANLRNAQSGDDLHIDQDEGELGLERISPERRQKASEAVDILRTAMRDTDWNELYPRWFGS